MKQAPAVSSIPKMPGVLGVVSSTLNFTKEGIEVQVGQVWQDLDKRMAGRQRTVIAVRDGKAHMGGAPNSGVVVTKISIARMHKSSTGWKLVK